MQILVNALKFPLCLISYLLRWLNSAIITTQDHAERKQIEAIYFTLKVPTVAYAYFTFSYTGEPAACTKKENAFSYGLLVVAAGVWHAKWLYLLGS